MALGRPPRPQSTHHIRQHSIQSALNPPAHQTILPRRGSACFRPTAACLAPQHIGQPSQTTMAAVAAPAAAPAGEDWKAKLQLPPKDPRFKTEVSLLRLPARQVSAAPGERTGSMLEPRWGFAAADPRLALPLSPQACPIGSARFLGGDGRAAASTERAAAGRFPLRASAGCVAP